MPSTAGQGHGCRDSGGDEQAPTYTAVRTHLSNLEQKGFVRFESDGGDTPMNQQSHATRWEAS